MCSTAIYHWLSDIKRPLAICRSPNLRGHCPMACGACLCFSMTPEYAQQRSPLWAASPGSHSAGSDHLKPDCRKVEESDSWNEARDSLQVNQQRREATTSQKHFKKVGAFRLPQSCQHLAEEGSGWLPKSKANPGNVTLGTGLELLIRQPQLPSTLNFGSNCPPPFSTHAATFDTNECGCCAGPSRMKKQHGASSMWSECPADSFLRISWQLKASSWQDEANLCAPSQFACSWC